jgi:hypothetical protein
MIFPSSPVWGSVAGVSIPARNDVQGIGLSVFDNTAFWGSAGRLQTVAVRSFSPSGPTIHEWTHRWGIYLSPSLGFQNCSGGHLGVIGVGTGQLGGFDPSTLIDNGNSTYTVSSFFPGGNGGDSATYSMLELYLLGLAGSTEVPSTLVPRNVDCASLIYANGKTTFRATGIDVISINDIVALHGPRIPSAAESQRLFRAAFVVVSDRPLNGAEMAFFNVQATLFGRATGEGSVNSFAQASRGRAEMVTVLPFIFADGFESGDTGAWTWPYP